MSESEIIQLIILILLIFLSAFFSSAETALTTVNKMRIRTLTEEGNKRALKVQKLIDEPTKMLSAILIGNNIVNLTASSLATTFTLSLCEHGGMGKNASLATGIATGILTILILIFGEITPKSLATIYSLPLSCAYAGFISFLAFLFTPVIFLLNRFSNLLLRLFHLDPNQKTSAITENELRTIVDVSHEEGVIESEERKMITNVVDFGDSYAKDVMVPRIDMSFVDMQLSYDELIVEFSKDKFTRMPVFDESHDNVIGIINLKDVFFYNGKKEDFQISNILRDAYFTYEFKKTSDLMIEMRKASIPMAIVLDEYGVTAGLLTMEDLLEEIVGEIRDEYDGDEEDIITKVNETEFVASGTARLEEINEIIGLTLDSNDYDSIAGHIISLLEHFPKEGESIQEENVLFTIDSMDKNRIEKVHIRLLPVDENNEDEQTDSQAEAESPAGQ